MKKPVLAEATGLLAGYSLAAIEKQNKENAVYIAKRDAFAKEAIELAKKHGFNIQTAANILQFAVPPKYTQEQLEAAFKLVQPPGNWKNPINKRVYLTDADKELVGEAVIHFTGGMAEFVPVPRKPQTYRVIAPGYYVSCGA